MYEASSKDPRTQSNPNYLISGAWTMWKIGKADEGMKMLEAAEKLELTDDRKEMLHRHRGYIQRELLKDYDGAVKSFETAIKFAGNRKSQVAVIWNNIGSAWEKAQEYEKALEAYKKVGTFNVKGWFVKSAEMSAKRMEKKINSGELFNYCSKTSAENICGRFFVPEYSKINNPSGKFSEGVWNS